MQKSGYFILLYLIANVQSEVFNMSRKRKLDDVDWPALENATEHKRILVLKKDNKEIYHCPVESCSHLSFTCKRGCRKHINNIHPWYFYFNENFRRDIDDQITSTSSNQDLEKKTCTLFTCLPTL